MLGALVLAGCGAGQDAATALTRPSIPGVSANAGDIHVRNAVVAYAPGGYAPGGNAPATLSVANAGPEPVRLTGFASAGAASVTVTSVTEIGAVSPAPGGGTATLPLEVAPGQLLAVAVELTGLGQPVTTTEAIPLQLSFDTGAEVTLVVPMDTPSQPQPRESPVVEPAH